MGGEEGKGARTLLLRSRSDTKDGPFKTGVTEWGVDSDGTEQGGRGEVGPQLSYLTPLPLLRVVVSDRGRTARHTPREERNHALGLWWGGIIVPVALLS